METLRPFYSAQFAVALYPAGLAVLRRSAAQAAAGFPSQRQRTNVLLQPMRCALDKEKERRSLQFKRIDVPGELPEDEAMEKGKKEGPLHHKTVYLNGALVYEAPKKSQE